MTKNEIELGRHGTCMRSLLEAELETGLRSWSAVNGFGAAVGYPIMLPFTEWPAGDPPDGCHWLPTIGLVGIRSGVLMERCHNEGHGAMPPAGDLIPDWEEALRGAR